MLYRSIIHQRQFRYLGAFYLHSIIRIFAVSIFQIFNGIYIFQALKGTGLSSPHSLAVTSLLFALMFLVQALSVAPSLWLISKRGLRFSVLWGNIFLVSFFALLYLGKFDPIFFVIAAVFGGLQIGMYWTAFHIYFVRLTDDNRQGEEISMSQSLSAIAAIGGPAFGGLIISYGGFGSVFLVMTILMVLATLPLKYLPKDGDKISVDILQTVKDLSPKEEEKSYLALLGGGAIDVSFSVFWPIFVFAILSGYVGVGFLGSLVALIGVMTTIAVGTLIDRLGAKKVLAAFSSLDSIVWVMMSLVSVSIAVFIVSALSALTKVGQLISLDSIIYERARHSDIVALVVQREVGLAVGKSILLLLMGFLFWFGLPLVSVLLLTAILALLTRLYPYDGIEPNRQF